MLMWLFLWDIVLSCIMLGEGRTERKGKGVLKNHKIYNKIKNKEIVTMQSKKPLFKKHFYSGFSEKKLFLFLFFILLNIEQFNLKNESGSTRDGGSSSLVSIPQLGGDLDKKKKKIG